MPRPSTPKAPRQTDAVDASPSEPSGTVKPPAKQLSNASQKKVAALLEEIAASPTAGKDKRSAKKRKRGRQKQANRPTPKEEIMILERQELVYELRKTGFSFRRISAHLTKKGYKASPATVFFDFKAYMDRKRETLTLNVSEMFDMAVENLDDLKAAVLPRALKYGKKDDVMSYLAIDKRQDDYLGLSKDKQSEIRARHALAQLIGVDPEQLDGIGDSN